MKCTIAFYDEVSVVKLPLYRDAGFFFTDLRLKNSDGYINLIKKANKADIPVRVRVYKAKRLKNIEIISNL